MQDISDAEKKPVSDMVRESLRKYIAVQRFRKLRNTVLPFAEAREFWNIARKEGT